MSGAEECPASSISSARAWSSAWEMLPEPSVLPVAEGASQRLDADDNKDKGKDENENRKESKKTTKSKSKSNPSSKLARGRSKADEIHGKDHDKDRDADNDEDADEDKNERRKERNKIQTKNAKKTMTHAHDLQKYVQMSRPRQEPQEQHQDQDQHHDNAWSRRGVALYPIEGGPRRPPAQVRRLQRCRQRLRQLLTDPTPHHCLKLGKLNLAVAWPNATWGQTSQDSIRAFLDRSFGNDQRRSEKESTALGTTAGLVLWPRKLLPRSASQQPEPSARCFVATSAAKQD